MDYGIFNVCTNVNACDCPRGCKVSTDSWLWEKNPLPHWGIAPASAACRSDALATELHPHPRSGVNAWTWSTTAEYNDLGASSWTTALRQDNSDESLVEVNTNSTPRALLWWFADRDQWQLPWDIWKFVSIYTCNSFYEHACVHTHIHIRARA